MSSLPKEVRSWIYDFFSNERFAAYLKIEARQCIEEKGGNLEHYGLSSLRIDEVATPEPGPNDVLVKVQAASVNPVDGKITKGYGGPTAQRKLPHVLGRDGAGTVAKVGSAVTAFKVGDEVYGVADPARWGTFAEYVAMPAATTAKRPAGLSPVDAGSLPIAGLSAWAGIVSSGHVAKDQRVLIHAGAGGVGSFAVQLAKHLGAWVAATAGTKNAGFVKSLGADQVIDYTKGDFAAWIKDVDLVFDLIGGDVRFKSFAVLKEARNVKYGNFVAPGNFLRVEVEYLKQTEAGASFKASGTVNGGNTAVTARIEIAYFNLGDKQPQLAELDARLIEHHRRRWGLIAPRQVSVALAN